MRLQDLLGIGVAAGLKAGGSDKLPPHLITSILSYQRQLQQAAYAPVAEIAELTEMAANALKHGRYVTQPASSPPAPVVLAKHLSDRVVSAMYPIPLYPCTAVSLYPCVPVPPSDIYTTWAAALVA